MRTKRGATTLLHIIIIYLVIDKMKSKLSKHWTTVETALQKINGVFLQNTYKLIEFRIALNNSFQALQDLHEEE